MPNRVVIAACALVLSACNNKDSSIAGFGNSRPAGVPEWVPIYAGTKATLGDKRKAGPVETLIQFGMDIPADCVKIYNWYQEQFKVSGFNAVGYSGWTNGYCSLTLNADGPGNVHSIRLNGSGSESSSQISAVAIEREMPGVSPSNDKTVPSWVPQYRGSTPSNLVVTNFGKEHRFEYNFTTNDDPKTILDWYEQQLRAAQFTLTGHDLWDAGGRVSASKQNYILHLRIETAGSARVVFIEARDGVD